MSVLEQPERRPLGAPSGARMSSDSTSSRNGSRNDCSPSSRSPEPFAIVILASEKPGGGTQDFCWLVNFVLPWGKVASRPAACALEAAIACCTIPMTIVEPAQWKRAHQLGGSDKEASRQRALQLFPAAHALFARRKDHGRAEAGADRSQQTGRLTMREMPRRDGSVVLYDDDHDEDLIIVEPTVAGFGTVQNNLHCVCGRPLQA